MHFPLQNKNKKGSMKIHAAFLVAYVRYHEPNHVGIINPFHLKTKWLNMVPNAWLTKKRCFFGHLVFLFTIAMHSLIMLESFISVKCCQIIGNQNCHSLDYRVEPSSCFYEKVHQVKLKYGNLAKIGAKDGSSYIIALSTAKHI